MQLWRTLRFGAAAIASLAMVLPAAAKPDVLLLLVGDSTVAPHNGYGDALCRHFDAGVACVNLARNGRSSGSFRAEGLWDEVQRRLRDAGASTTSHVLIQFGHNDQPGKPGRSTELATEYPANLARYVAEVRALGGVPVLVTPLTRRSFQGGQLVQDLRPWAEAVRAVAVAQRVTLIDLNASSAAAVQAMGQAEADTLAFAPPPPPGQPASGAYAGFDRTHLGAKGACVFGAMVAGELKRQLPAMAARGINAPRC